MVAEIGCIIQARMGSTRLPGKVLMKLEDKTVLGHILTRLKQVKNADVIIVATSTSIEDNKIKDECNKYGVECFRGELKNVLSRYYHAATLYGLTDIVRICADNTILNWEIIDKQIEAYLKSKPDILCCGENITLGTGGEIFSYDMLKQAYLNAKEDYQYEHVTPYIYENSNHIVRYDIEEDLSKYRFTLDTQDDWALIQKIYEHLYKKNALFTLEEAIELINTHPELYRINENIKQIKVLKMNRDNKYVKV